MYFALVSASSSDNVNTLQTEGTSDKTPSDGVERGQRNSSNLNSNRLKNRLSTEVCANLKIYHLIV